MFPLCIKCKEVCKGGVGLKMAKDSVHKGLSHEEVERSRATHGANVLQKQKRKSFWRVFFTNLGDRVPMIFDYVYEHASPNDYFVTGDSGAGYINPDMLPDLDTWVEYNEPYLAKYDMDIVGFIITSRCKMTEEIMAAYAKISPVGAFHNDIKTQLVVYDSNTVFMHLMNEIVPSGDDFTPRQMYEYLMGNGTNFAAYRAVNKSPTAINEAIDKFIAYAEKRNVTVKCVDPYTLFDLVLQSGQGEYID